MRAPVCDEEWAVGFAKVAGPELQFILGKEGQGLDSRAKAMVKIQQSVFGGTHTRYKYGCLVFYVQLTTIFGRLVSTSLVFANWGSRRAPPLH